MRKNFNMILVKSKNIENKLAQSSGVDASSVQSLVVQVNKNITDFKLKADQLFDAHFSKQTMSGEQFKRSMLDLYNNLKNNIETETSQIVEAVQSTSESLNKVQQPKI